MIVATAQMNVLNLLLPFKNIKQLAQRITLLSVTLIFKHLNIQRRHTRNYILLFYFSFAHVPSLPFSRVTSDPALPQATFLTPSRPGSARCPSSGSLTVSLNHFDQKPSSRRFLAINKSRFPNLSQSKYGFLTVVLILYSCQ
ncbi:Hypothetical_protein [Hexamita inflata]|uniref:Hypothetical_protein n=1 Tax=Hexamita inflata TaxID=28002 RepID=A0AA86NMQ3_9EUKA|nr:Hypothetical protein HINF_LOCUS9486 [Hexamita inflata]